ncbi:MAG: hypothetical protein AAF411_28565, partial [Myxococcota bacterium]
RRMNPHAAEAAIVGRVPALIEAHLRNEGALNGLSLAEQIRDHVYDAAQRRRYVAEGLRYLRSKRPPLSERYDVVLVGAGIHAAVWLYTVMRVRPELKVLVVEQSANVCSTFARLGDSLILNSPTSSRVGLNANIAPGHFVQVSDFDELATRTFPTAKHLHELAAMMLFHADANVAFEFSVGAIERSDDGYVLRSDDRHVRANTVVVCNGMGGHRRDAFRRDARSEQVVCGDEFIRACYDEHEPDLTNQTVAVVGAGDTANCVMEYLLPLTYPRRPYSSLAKDWLAPKKVYWIGQSAANVRDFYFANKQRYCYSGGIIEFFWHGDAPFDLPTDAWNRSKALITCVPDRLTSLTHRDGEVELVAGKRRLRADLCVDCTGRFNALSARLLDGAHEYVEGDVVFHGGGWDASLDRYVIAPRTLHARRLACKLQGERIFLLGSACDLDALIDDGEARNGSLKYQDHRTSATNSKWSLEHTLPRTVAFAEQVAEFV